MIPRHLICSAAMAASAASSVCAGVILQNCYSQVLHIWTQILPSVMSVVFKEYVYEINLIWFHSYRNTWFLTMCIIIVYYNGHHSYRIYCVIYTT